LPKWQKSDKSGVDVVITIFCDFSAKRFAFFLYTNVMMNFFAKFSLVLSQKRQFFSQNFSAKIFLKIITSVPDHSALKSSWQQAGSSETLEKA
jgi:hypothetical protein